MFYNLSSKRQGLLWAGGASTYQSDCSSGRRKDTEYGATKSDIIHGIDRLEKNGQDRFSVLHIHDAQKTLCEKTLGLSR